jgi:tetratricopeptide (TPR) repeat protein
VTPRVPWWLAVFAAALALRLAFVFLVDEPLLYTHQYNYFNGGLKIAERADPWTYVLASDEWHTWGDGWTMAPLYHLFVGAVFRLTGRHLRTLQVLQCLLDAFSAVMVGALGRALGGRGGTWAGLAYAVYWPAVELPSRTLTENLHTPLLLAGLATFARSPAGGDPPRQTIGRAAAGGFLVGLSAMARAVSAAFLPLAALWRWRQRRGKAGAAEAAAILLAGAAAILPWTVRNAVVIGDPVMIETVGIWNAWTDNAFVDPHRYDVQALRIHKEPTPAGKRALALAYARRGLRESPGSFARKVWDNFEHFFRPEGLHQLLTAEQPRPAWRSLASLVLDDGILVAAVLLFVVFVAAGRKSPAAALVLLWMAYYLFMLVVVFHNEIRYRSAIVPVLLAGAIAGVTALIDRGARRRPVGVGLSVGILLAGLMVVPFAAPASRALRASWFLRPARAAVQRGDLSAASTAAFAAAGRDPDSARPWLTYGRWLVEAGRTAEAIDAYERAERRRPDHWTPRLVLPRLLRDAGRTEEADARLREANQLSINVDPWLALEVAWRELTPPRTDEILLGRDGYGAVRGFLQPRKDHRWTRHRAWLRLIPTSPAASYDLTLAMGSREPAPNPSPRVRVRAGGRAASFTLTRQVRPYTFRAPAPADGPLLVEIEAPTWNLSDQPPEQGIRLDRVTIVPAR